MPLTIRGSVSARFKGAVFSSERSLKRSQNTAENINAARIHCTQTVLALENVQGSAALSACFCQHKRATRKIKCRKLIAACELRSGHPPMQTPSDHQMQDQPQVVFHSNRDTLADMPQLAHPQTFNTRDGRFHRAQQERTCQPHMFDWFTDNA